MKNLLRITCALGLVIACAGAYAIDLDMKLLGDPVPVKAAGRTIVIMPDTRWANVEEGETVKFVVNGHEFAYYFNGQVGDFDLEKIAPPGVLDHPVRVYMSNGLRAPH
jgi:Heavy-metal resistance protein CzcE